MMRWGWALAAALAMVPGAARADWHEASGKHFVVYSDDEPETIRAFTASLERFDKAVRVLRGIPDPAIGPNNRLTVFLVKNPAAVGRLAHNSYITGFFIPRAGGALAVVPRSGDGSGIGDPKNTSVLLHEYAHYLMSSAWPDAAFPLWFSEGFAQFHATAEFEPDGAVTLGLPVLDRGYDILVAEKYSIGLLLVGRGDFGQNIYGRGWLLTHYLSFNPERKAQFATFLDKLNAGVELPEAAKAFGSLQTLDRELRAYARQKSFSNWHIAASALPIAPIALRALSAGEAATMPVRIRSQVGVLKHETEGVAKDAKAAAPYPADAAAQVVLAEAELDAEHPDAALAAAERALAADPRSVPALILKARALMAAAAKAKSKDAALWGAARAPLLAANRIDTEDPEPLMLFYASFLAADETPTRNAGDALLKAEQLAPFDSDLRLMAAHLLIQRRDAASAKRMLGPVAYNPHGGNASALATKVIAALDRQDWDGALKLGDDESKDAKASAD